MWNRWRTKSLRSALADFRRNPAAWAAGIIILSTCARLWIIGSGQLDLVQDEAQYWDWSRHLQLSYYSKGPLIAWAIHLFTGLFGVTEFGVRFGAVLCSCLSQILLYKIIARYLRRPALAALTLFIANTTPLFLAGGILMTTDSPLLFFWIAALLCLLAGLEKPAAVWPWTLLVLFLAFGVLAKYTMLLLVPLALLHALWLARRSALPPLYLRRLLPTLLVGGMLGLAPILLWNAQNDWVGFRHVEALSGLSKSGAWLRPDRWLEYLGGQFGLLLPWWLIFCLIGAWRAVRALWKKSSFDHADSQNALLVLLFWPLWLFFALWSLKNRVYINWSALSYVPGLIFAASTFERVLQKRLSGLKNPAARLAPLWLGLSLFCFVLIYGQDITLRHIPLPEKYNPTVRLKGWEDLGRKLEEIRLGLPDPDKVFFFSDSYDMTAALAFYAPGRPVTYCADFGRRKSQYDLWPGPLDKKGWDAVYVSRKPRLEPPAQLQRMFKQVGDVWAYLSRHRDGPGREFGIVILRDFNGFWPESGKNEY